MDTLEQRLGYTFRNKELLRGAMIHSSYANENRRSGAGCNERLEFLGDAILGMAVAERLFADEPDMSRVKLIIWDMDETFWSGTLTEGEVHVSDAMDRLIRDLSSRGIVNSISSKNDWDAVASVLAEMGDLGDYFVFNNFSILHDNSFSTTSNVVSCLINNLKFPQELPCFC